MPAQATFIFLFVAVLALIGVGAWLVRRFTSNRLGSNTNRGRMPRLAVIDAAAVDGRRRLVLVRRDNVEHLLMIGGPTDIVVEPNIVRATTQRDQAPQRAPVGTELPHRVAPLPDVGHWADAVPDAPDFHDQVVPELPPRPTRPSFSEEVRRPSPAISERRPPDPLAALAPEPRPEGRMEPPPRMRPIPRSERSAEIARAPSLSMESPVKAPSIRPQERTGSPAAVSAADQNLAEMAQRLEAALRRPGGDAVAADRAPPVAPEPPSRPAPRHANDAPANGPQGEPPVTSSGQRASFENLEDEMASLLGRPKTPT
jgi:flagellar biogenesis protein FliO